MNILYKIIFFFSFIFIVNCTKEEKKDNYAILGLLLLDQLSGNCVKITKSENVYVAQASLRPKGSCNDSLSTDLYSASASEIKIALDSFYDTLILEYGKYSSCSAESTQIAATKALISEAGLSILLNSQTSCGLAGFRFLNNRVGFILGCKTSSIAESSSSKIRYISVSNVATDMAAKLADLKLAATNDKISNGWSDLAIAAMRPMNGNELDILASPTNYARFYSSLYSSTSSACAQEILANNSPLKTILAAGGGKSITSEADASAVKEVIVNDISLVCYYGSGFTEVTTPTTTSISTVLQKCPAGYPIF